MAEERLRREQKEQKLEDERRAEVEALAKAANAPSWPSMRIDLPDTATPAAPAAPATEEVAEEEEEEEEEPREPEPKRRRGGKHHSWNPVGEWEPDLLRECVRCGTQARKQMYGPYVLTSPDGASYESALMPVCEGKR